VYNPFDHYFKQAKKKGFKARSAFKLDEIQNKFKIIDKNVKTALDIGCTPGSWLQYTVAQLKRNGVKNYKICGFDIQETDINLPWVKTFVQDVSDREAMQKILDKEKYEEKKVDLIISDMAPNTIGIKDIDSIRLFDLLNQVMWVYKKYLKTDGKFAVKVFMGPEFEEFVADMKKNFGGRNIKVFKPQACRKESKETYVVKFR